MFNTTPGRSYLADYRGIGQEDIAALSVLGLSLLANILGAIKYAKYIDLDADDVVLTLATDGASMYQTELNIAEAKNHAGKFDQVLAAETFGRVLLGATTDHMIELTHLERERVFNFGYYTWVEQQGIDFDHFDRRRSQPFWDDRSRIISARKANARESNRYIDLQT